MANLGIQNNNPGNLRDPKTGSFQVFTSPEEGHKALLKDIQLKQSGGSSHIKPGASLEEFANVWAPASDKNNPKDYAHTLANFLGVPTAYAFDEVPPEKLAEGIKVAEGTSSMKTNDKTNNQSNPQTKQLTHSQLVENINAMEQQGAKPEEVQGYLDSLKSNTSNTQKSSDDLTKDTIISTGNTQPGSYNTNSKAGENVGTVGKIAQTVGAPVGLDKLGQGIAYAISGKGNQKVLQDSLNSSYDIQGKLVQKIKELKSKGQNTSKLDSALKDITQNINDTTNKLGDVGTGGLSNKDIGNASLKLAALPAASYASGVLSGGRIMNTARGLESGVLGKSIPKFLSSPELESALKSVPNGIKNMSEFTNANMKGKYDLLDEALKGAKGTEKKLLEQIMQKIEPQALKEAGLKVPFSQLNPKTAKALKITGGVLKKGLGTAATLGVGAEGMSLYNKYIK